MSVLSFSVQYPGEQSPGTKPAEDLIEENMLLQQREGRELSLAILDKEHLFLESDQAQQVLDDELDEKCGEDDNLNEANNGLARHSVGKQSFKEESSQTLQEGEKLRNHCEAGILKTDSSPIVACDILNCSSDAEATVSKEEICKETDERVTSAKVHSFFCLQCNNNCSCHEHKLGEELIKTTCGSSDCVSHVEGLGEGKHEIVASNSGTSIVIHTPDSHGEDEEQPRTHREPSNIAFTNNFEQDNFSLHGMRDCNQDGATDPLGTEYLEDHTVALWVKWRGKWQTGFQCPRIDCPLPTLRAKPTHERKKYIAIFFPRTRTYSWADILLVQPINEFPEPLASGTHRRWRKLVKDLTTPRRFIMQKLAVAMLNISDQLHTEAVTEDARKATTWKEFAMEASRCRDYSDLGRMLLKLQTMILPNYVSSGWLETTFSSWMHRCQSVQSADSVEILTQELVASVEWDKVDELWNASVQPELGLEWKTWKQEAMKWFSISHPVGSFTDVEQKNCDTSNGLEPQYSRKRLKLEIRRAEGCATQMEFSDSRIPSQSHRVDTDSGHSISQDNLGSTLVPVPRNVEVLSGATEAMDSGTRWDEISVRSEDINSIQSSVVLPSNGKTGMIAMENASYQYRQCSAFIAAKGRQCGRWASDGEVFCCVHLNARSGGKLPLEEQRPPPDAPMCAGVTTHGDKCKHRARLGSAFCKKHRLQRNDDSIMKMDNLSTPCGSNLKRKFGDNNATEKFSSSNASNCEEFALVREPEISTQEMLIPVAVGVTLDERNCLMKESDLYSALPTPVRAISPDLPRCVGYYGQNNGEQCLQDAKKHTLYCEKHLPKFLKRARNGKSRLVSKDVFIHLLRNCSSRKQKLYLHQACEILYGFMKSSLSCQKPVSKGDIMEWILSEASKDVNVGEYLLKLVSSEREKIVALWGFSTTEDKQAYTSEANAPSTIQRHGKDHKPEKTIKCKICAEEFPDDQSIGVHWSEIHKKEARWLFRGYACSVCMNSFTNRKVLETHIKERHGVQFLEHSILFRCMSCSSHFVNPEQLWQHVLSFHLIEFRMPDHSPENFHSLDHLHQVSQQTIKSGNKFSQNNADPEKGCGSHRYICRFCGLKFDLLPDLGRHHQVAHMKPTSASQLQLKRRNPYVKHSRPGHSRFKQTFGAAFRFKSQTSFGIQKHFRPSTVFSLMPKLKNPTSEKMALGKLLESHCSDVANTLFSEIQKTKGRPNNLEIISVARSSCCRISLHATLEIKYGILPENLYLKAAKLCSELNIEVGWHLEGFICPKGCQPLVKPQSATLVNPLSDGTLYPPTQEDLMNDTNWDMEECHFILNPKDFNWKPMEKVTVLCEDISFGKESVPVACVVDEDLNDSLKSRFNEASFGQATPMPWQSFTYVTERLIEPSLSLDSKNSLLGCACPQAKCFPEKCDHVYLFDNDYENAEDIHGKPMQGRFPYDERGRIVLEEGYLVYECNSSCKCDATCHNRVLQKGVQVKLEIFKTEKKGWAVRAGEAIARGTFVCEYVGEVLNDVEANKRGERCDSNGCSYLYDIDAHMDGARGMNEGTVPYVIDATRYGNVSRFINHSCSPNLVNYLVLVESMDFQLGHVGFYASRDIAVGEELAYGYRYKLPSGGCPCHCGAANCRQLY